MKKIIELNLLPTTFGRNSVDNISRIEEAFMSLYSIEAKIKHINISSTENRLRVELFFDNQNDLKLVIDSINFSKLINVCLLFTGLNGYEEHDEESILPLPKKRFNPHKKHHNYNVCDICTFTYTDEDLKIHKKMHYHYVLFFIKNNYDFGIKGSVLLDNAKWKIEEILYKNLYVPLHIKVKLSLDLLKGEYLQDGKNIRNNISFEDYVREELKENNRKHKSNFEKIGVLDILYKIFK